MKYLFLLLLVLFFSGCNSNPIKSPSSAPVEEEFVNNRQHTQGASVKFISTGVRAEIRRDIEMLRSELAARSGLRRRFVSASTLDHRYAAYHDAWRRVVERTVSRNYPAEAKEKKLAGSLVLHVAIRSDGSATETRIVRSSGYQALDKAALYVIRMAEPFAPFSDAIRKETDMIDIASVWHFRLGDE